MVAPQTPRRSARLAAASSPTKECQEAVLKRSLHDAKVADLFSARPCKVARTSPDSSPSSVPSQETSRSEQLVGRDTERQKISAFLQGCFNSEHHQQSKKSSLYISGGPGTGKTCLVRETMAELLCQQPKVKHVEVNCMTLPKRTLVGALARIAELCAGSGSARVLQGRSGKSLAFAAMSQIAKVDAPVVIVLDEIDQLVQKSTGSTGAECPLETLFTLPLIPCKHPIAVVAIANAVDLLQRRSVPVVAQSLAQSLIFEPYTASELRAISEAYLSTYEHRSSLEKDLGKVGIELRVREVAKNSGDCRRLLSLFSQAVIEDDIMRGAPPTLTDKSEDKDAEPVVKKAAATVPRNQHDPIDTIKHLPVEHQVLLGALAGARSEAIPLSEATSRYKALCLRLHQPLDLARKALLKPALQTLESRGLLDVRTTRRSSDPVASLAVSRKALNEALSKANPLLGQFLQE